MGLFGFGGPSEQDILMETSLAFYRELKKNNDCKEAFKKLKEEMEKIMELHCSDVLSTGWMQHGSELYRELSSDPKEMKNRFKITEYVMESVYYIKKNKYSNNPQKMSSLNNMISEYFDSYFK